MIKKTQFLTLIALLLFTIVDAKIFGRNYKNTKKDIFKTLHIQNHTDLNENKIQYPTKVEDNDQQYSNKEEENGQQYPNHIEDLNWSMDFEKMNQVETFFAFIQFQSPLLSFFLGLIPVIMGTNLLLNKQQNVNTAFMMSWIFMVLSTTIMLMLLLLKEDVIVSNVALLMISYVWGAVCLGVYINHKYKSFQIQFMISCCFGLMMNSCVDVPWLTITLSSILFLVLIIKEAYFHVQLLVISHVSNNNARDMKTTNIVQSIFGSFLFIDGIFVTFLVWPMHTTCSSYGMWLRLLKAVLILGSSIKCYKYHAKAQTLEQVEEVEPVEDDKTENLYAQTQDQVITRQKNIEEFEKQNQYDNSLNSTLTLETADNSSKSAIGNQYRYSGIYDF